MSERSTRLLLIYSRLKSGPVTIELLQQWAHKYDIQVSGRTLYRDLLTLETSLTLPDEKLVVSIGEKNRKIWKLEYENDEQKLTSFDVNSYMLFRNFLPLPIIDSRKSSLHKIVRLFYRQFSSSDFEKYTSVSQDQIRCTHFGEARSFGDYHKMLDDCIWSIQNRREIELREIKSHYTSATSGVQLPLRFLPVQLLYHRGTVQLSGFLKQDDSVFIIAMDQIRTYKLTNEQFDTANLLPRLEKELDCRFGIMRNLNDEIYDIVLEFAEFTGNYIESQRWHSNQKFERLENGNHLMRFRCGINRELIGWIFSWSVHVKIHEPAILRELVREKYKEADALYDSEETMAYSEYSF